MAYEAALVQVGEALRKELELGEEEDISEYARAYAQILGVTDTDYTDVYRTQLARTHYPNNKRVLPYASGIAYSTKATV